MKDVETEIKLLATPAALEALRDHPLLAGKDHAANLVTTYFDTPDGKLRRAGATLRLRSGDGELEQTFKHTPRQQGQGETVSRREWNARASGDRPDPARFPADAAATLTGIIEGQQLTPYATVTVQRTTRNIRHGAALIEVAFDSGTISASGRNEPICELELELRDGGLADALQLALALPLGPDLRWSAAAKGSRAYALAHGTVRSASRATDITLAPKMTIAQALRTICWSCLDHLLDNQGVLLAGHSNDALHQCRVAIRRLRAALSLFASSTDHDAAARFRKDFGRAATAMGEARELHVLLEALAKADAGPPPSDLGPELEARREAALAAAAAHLASEAFQRLLFAFASWIETAEIDAPETLPEFAAQILDRLRKKIKHAARHLHTLTDDELHTLRIKVKKLRYAVEFFAGLAPPDQAKAAHHYANRLGKLQDQLGLLHDLSEHTADGPLFAVYDPPRAAQLQDELARRLGPAEAVRDDLIDGSAKALAKLLALPRWWHTDSTETDMAHDSPHDSQHDGDQLKALQIRLTAMQRQVIAKGHKLLIILEGRDAAGKDGTIKHIVEHMSPRETRVVALGVPSEHDRKAWYFQRWCAQLPVAGEIVLFNRSWYNRAGVERVMGFCTDAEYEEFMASVVDFEQLLVRSGLTIIKYYLDITKDVQKHRLHERETNPLKQWKISPIDRKATKNWHKYSAARNAMLARTHSVFAPWVVVKANDKPIAHLALIRDLLARSGAADPDTANSDGEALPDPTTAFIYDAHALENGWLAE